MALIRVLAVAAVVLLAVVIYQQNELRHLQELLRDCGGVRYEIKKFKKSRLEAPCDTAAVIRWYEALPRKAKKQF